MYFHSVIMLILQNVKKSVETCKYFVKMLSVWGKICNFACFFVLSNDAWIAKSQNYRKKKWKKLTS